MKPTASQIRAMRRDNMRWPIALTAVPVCDWPIDRLKGGDVRIGLFRSRTFCVQVFDVGRDMVRLSINRCEWDERHNRFRDDIAWDDLQRLKAEAGYGDRCALEVMPPDEPSGERREHAAPLRVARRRRATLRVGH